MMVNNNLVGGIPSPLKNMSSSVGMMTFPIYGKNPTIPKHQPAIDLSILNSIETFVNFFDLSRDPFLVLTSPLTTSAV